MAVTGLHADIFIYFVPNVYRRSEAASVRNRSGEGEAVQLDGDIPAILRFVDQRGNVICVVVLSAVIEDGVYDYLVFRLPFGGTVSEAQELGFKGGGVPYGHVKRYSHRLGGRPVRSHEQAAG